ncbi:hypothetical protein PM082_011962 [Marasmius tenuissimus]|nr:hypothetical protein PM082_011962 [Marasmius tenuissimus]
MSRQVNPEFPGHFDKDPPNQFVGSISASESISTNRYSRRKERQAVFGSSIRASEYQIDVQSTPRIGTLNTVAPLPPSKLRRPTAMALKYRTLEDSRTVYVGDKVLPERGELRPSRVKAQATELVPTMTPHVQHYISPNPGKKYIDEPA